MITEINNSGLTFINIFNPHSFVAQKVQYLMWLEITEIIRFYIIDILMCIVTSYDAISYAHSNRLKAEYFAKRTYPNLYLRTRYDQNNLRKNCTKVLKNFNYKNIIAWLKIGEKFAITISRIFLLLFIFIFDKTPVTIFQSIIVSAQWY